MALRRYEELPLQDCPLCHQPGRFCWLGESTPEDDGVIAMMQHGEKVFNGPFGSSVHPVSRCFLKESDFDEAIKEKVKQIREWNKRVIEVPPPNYEEWGL